MRSGKLRIYGLPVVNGQKLAVEMSHAAWSRRKSPFYMTLQLSGYQKGYVKRGREDF